MEFQKVNQHVLILMKRELIQKIILKTFVALKLEINNWRWSGVPFYLRTGKRMHSKSSEIVVRV